jgi:hypothetical protein
MIEMAGRGVPMSPAAQLFNRVVESLREEQAFIHLTRIIDPLRCVRFPTGNEVKVSRLRETPDHCRVLEAADLREFHVHQREQWASYQEIATAYGHGATHISKLSQAIVEAREKLIVSDHSDRLWCHVTSERVYPKRAWVGTLAPGWDLEMAFVVAAILNSAIGPVLYAQTAQRVGVQGRDLRKAVLEGFPIPAPALQPAAFSQLAQISYRLHQLYEAQTACKVDLYPVIRSHWLYLLPQVVKLYGWSEPDARLLLTEAPPTRDQSAAREHLFSTWPQTPLRPVRLVSDELQERLEALKTRKRAGSLSPEEAVELTRLTDALYWEQCINGPVPSRLPATPWPGVASELQAIRAVYGYLSRTRGQRFAADRAIRKSERIWEVPIYRMPPRVTTSDARHAQAGGGEVSGKHLAGMLYVDAITGKVSDTLERAQHAVAPQSG